MDCRRMEAVGVVTIDALDEDAALRLALGKTLATHIVQEHPSPDVPSGFFNGGVTVYIGEETEGKAVSAGTRVGVAINDDL